jgi:hypothetical protein
MMSHNTFGGMAVLALGLTCGEAFGQGMTLGGEANAQVGASASTEAAATGTADAGADASANAASETPVATSQSGQAAMVTTPPTAETGEWLHQLLPVDGMVEIGLAAGLLFVSRHHNFQLEERPHQRIGTAPELALRTAWFPIRFAGGEVEGAMGASTTEDGKAAYPWSFRVSAVGQVALWRVTPFGLFGFGRIGNFSKPMGNDGDPLFHVGIGAKAFLSELFAVRLDARDNLAQRNGSTEGMLAHNFELQLGASLTLGRPPAPSRPELVYY